MPDADKAYMSAALALGRRGFGLCAPNPSVGALLVKDGIIIGRGWTKPGGRPHAETEALRAAGAKARGATLYVSLEPCSHHGQTPPCTDAIIAAGVGRVVFALEDPDPRAGGRGAQILERAGCKVTRGVHAEEARRAHLGHILRVTEGRPLVTLKIAVTADFFAAGAPGDARLFITGPEAKGRVHMMRAMHDAVMIGVDTVIADNPLLNVRLPGLEGHAPLRIVLDSDLRMPLWTQLAGAAAEGPILVIAAEGASEEKAARLRKEKFEVVFVRRGKNGHLDLAAALRFLGDRGLTRVFCEGGPRVAAALVGQGLADDVMVFTGPEPLGHAGTLGLDTPASARLVDPASYRLVETRMVGADQLTYHERVL